MVNVALMIIALVGISLILWMWHSEASALREEVDVLTENNRQLADLVDTSDQHLKMKDETIAFLHDRIGSLLLITRDMQSETLPSLHSDKAWLDLYREFGIVKD